MSQGTVMIQAQNRLHEKDFTVATPEEFVHRFGGTGVINKVSIRFWRVVARDPERKEVDIATDLYLTDCCFVGADRQQWYCGS